MIETKHIQPMSAKELAGNSFESGKKVFLLSLLGNFIILVLFATLVLIFYSYIESLGVDNNTLYILAMFNNLIFISLTSVNIFYLLIGNQEESYLNQVKNSLIRLLIALATLIVSTLIYSILVIFGLTLLIVPGILIFTYFGLYSQAIAFEDEGIITSILRSRELVKGSFWKVFITLSILNLIVNIFIFLIGGLILLAVPIDSIWLEIGIITLTYLIIMPFVGSYYTFLYFDLRSRQEAFDYDEYEKRRVEISS